MAPTTPPAFRADGDALVGGEHLPPGVGARLPADAVRLGADLLQ
ncbi:hypothetical protein ABZ832_17550 [Streptantibioticus parmotrematis]